MLRDRLACGVEEPRMQRWLLAEHDLTFVKAFELASAADKNAKDLQSTKLSTVLVNRLNHHQQKGRVQLLWREPSSDGLSFQNGMLYKCRKKAHLARVYRSKTLSKKEQCPQRQSNSCSATHVLTEDSRDYSMYNVTGLPVQPLKVTIM